MGRVDDYRCELRQLEEWEPYLLAHSSLPGPRANLELARAVAEEGTEARFTGWLTRYPVHEAPVGTSLEFLPCCAAMGYGRLAADGLENAIVVIRRCAGDGRWRVREMTATGLQIWGMRDFWRMLAAIAPWCSGTWLEKRAVAAALCEPTLLNDPDHALVVLQYLDQLTDSLESSGDRRGDGFRVFRQAMGYCWSVAVASLPSQGIPMMERWMSTDDPDVQWVMRDNLKKKRLAACAPEWTAARQSDIGRPQKKGQ